ncbi:MAG: hypothetical protein ABI390_10885 [Daejeonella sp.]
MKRFLILIMLLGTFNFVSAGPVEKTDEEIVSQLFDDLNKALLEKNKTWLEENLLAETSMTDPGGDVMDHDRMISVFTGTIYQFEKIDPGKEKQIKIEDKKAMVNSDINVVGSAIMQSGELADISAQYNMRVNFVKTDSGWKILAVNVSR